MFIGLCTQETKKGIKVHGSPRSGWEGTKICIMQKYCLKTHPPSQVVVLFKLDPRSDVNEGINYVNMSSYVKENMSSLCLNMSGQEHEKTSYKN